MEDNVECWQSKVITVQGGMRELYDRKHYFDIIIKIKCDDQVQAFEAHRLFLAARSPIFENILSNVGICEEISIENVSFRGFELLLQYVYTDECSNNSEAELLECYKAARQYEIEGLCKKCEEDFKVWSISIDNVFGILDKSLEANVTTLKERCLHFIAAQPLSVIESDSFPRATYICIEALLKSEALSSVILKVRLHHIMRWGKQQFTVGTDYSKVRNYMEDLLPHLKIQHLSSGEIGTFINDYENFLKNDEVVALVANAANRNTSRQLPSWCQD